MTYLVAKKIALARRIDMRILLLGLESSGKTTLLKGLVSKKVQVQGSNVKGSTSTVFEVEEEQVRYVDTPGIRLGSELVSSQNTEKMAASADQIWLVLRGTHFKMELEALEKIFSFHDKPVVLIVTFEDKMDEESLKALHDFTAKTKFPLKCVDTRSIDFKIGKQLHEIGRFVTSSEIDELANLPIKKVKESQLMFQKQLIGPYLALFSLLGIYTLPIFLAYQFSIRAEGSVEFHILEPMMSWSSAFPEPLIILLFGDYGLLSLGAYSFIWAFPVVILFALAVGITEESGLKDRITDSLDPLMRKAGLTGQDLVPIISGFGCNVVAVQASRSCNICTRKNCISVISFGSACSYQLGATLSVFGASGNIVLIIPYMVALIVISLIHVKVWNRRTMVPLFQKRDSFLQWPSGQTLWYRIKPVVSQFLLQAMPIFLSICLIASMFELLGWMGNLKNFVAPLLVVIGLSADIAPAFIASLFRKDGILLLNQGSGSVLVQMEPGELFIAVFLCSTFTACLVTLVKIIKELSWKDAVLIAGKQMTTSIVSVIVFSILFSIYEK
jgi:ferrous iron transport protein B